MHARNVLLLSPVIGTFVSFRASDEPMEILRQMIMCGKDKQQGIISI